MKEERIDMIASQLFDRTHFLRGGEPTTVTVLKEEAQWEDENGYCFWSEAIQEGCWCVGIRLHILEHPGKYLELDDNEYRYYEYVGPVLRLYPSNADISGVEVF